MIFVALTALLIISFGFFFANATVGACPPLRMWDLGPKARWGNALAALVCIVSSFVFASIL